MRTPMAGGDDLRRRGNPVAVMGKPSRLRQHLGGQSVQAVRDVRAGPSRRSDNDIFDVRRHAPRSPRIVGAERTGTELHGIRSARWRVPVRRARSLPRARWCPEQQARSPSWSRCETTATPCWPPARSICTEGSSQPVLQRIHQVPGERTHSFDLRSELAEVLRPAMWHAGNMRSRRWARVCNAPRW